LLLENENVALRLAPELGGGVDSFRWRGRDIFHARPGAAGPLALGSFALSPFSGRIAQGRFAAHGSRISLKRNHPSDPDHPHALHGFDWLAPFEMVEATEMRAVLRRIRHADEWPWGYEAEQVFTLTNDGYRHAISITNLSAEPMPAGLGLHPFFPREQARLLLDINGVWETQEDLIPSYWRALLQTPDWLSGAAIDHCFTGRRGAIVIDWPSHRLAIEPDPAFSFAVVFTPPGEDYFCVEPVSHMPDAVNRREPPGETGLRWLAPGERWTASTSFDVSPNS
jgi:aldose 1-epimerase